MKKDCNTKKSSILSEIVTVIVQGLLGALLIRTFLFQPFSIPSSSMQSTLLIGDYLFVSKYSYGYSNNSFPLSPNLFSGRIWSEDPKRGDVAVFKSTRDNKTDYIKRVIGLPGDSIQMLGGVLYINGQAVPKNHVGMFETKDISGFNLHINKYRETLSNGVSYFVLDIDAQNSSDNTEEYIVPPGHYFMMGDNRDNSLDSRVPLWAGGIGFVPIENFIGRAEVVFFSIEDGVSAWQIGSLPGLMRWDRFWQAINE